MSQNKQIIQCHSLNYLKQNEQILNSNNSNQQYNYQFYEEYKKLFQTTISLSIQMKYLNKRKQQAWQRLNRYQKKAQQFRDDIRGEGPQRKKRSRRTADQIQRQYKCDTQKCNKSYGTEGSLYQHIKLKHKEKYQKLKMSKSFKSIQEGFDQQDDFSQVNKSKSEDQQFS